jgi:hypothetical protein
MVPISGGGGGILVDALKMRRVPAADEIKNPGRPARAMSGRDRLLGWFPHNYREWIEFIIVAVLLWLLMVVAISELELSSSVS